MLEYKWSRKSKEFFIDKLFGLFNRVLKVIKFLKPEINLFEIGSADSDKLCFSASLTFQERVVLGLQLTALKLNFALVFGCFVQPFFNHFLAGNLVAVK